jgi:YidC/Oxa1 family membrane protein insertase
VHKPAAGIRHNFFMDRKSIIVLILCFFLLVCWRWVVDRVYPPKPLPPGSTNAPIATLTSTNQGATSGPVATSFQATSAPQLAPNPNSPEEQMEVTNANAHYTFTSHGGGLKLVELLQYPETVATHGDRRTGTNRVATLNTFTPAPSLAILGGYSVQGDDVFKLTRLPNGVRAEKTLTNGLSLVKDFELSTNYLVLATARLENHSAAALSLPAQEWFAGTATPMNAQDKGTAVGVMWYNGNKAQDTLGASYFSSRGVACTPRVPPAEYRGGASNVFWAAAHNQFFALVVMPHDPADQIVMRKIDLPRPTLEEVRQDTRVIAEPVGYTAALVYPAITLAPNQTLQREVALYAGPKEYRTLATISAGFNNNVDLVMGFGFWGFFSKALLLGMNTLHSALRLPYGWAIIVITVIIKVVFWPLTQASTRSAKRMQALQPQIKALQEKYKDDPVKAQRKMMEFWKEHKINPMSGCLPTLIQMPVFFGFFFMIGSAIELRGASFLWVRDLSRPDTLFLIPGLNFPFNLLPLIMGATMLYQAHLTPPSPGMDPAQAKMMRYMPLIFLVFLYNYSAGLTLYWTVQNVLSIVQTKLTRTMPEPSPPSPTGRAPALTPPPKKRK